MDGLRGQLETDLWPAVERLLDSYPAAGLAVAVVRDDEVVARGFGVRDLRTGEPVTAETAFHLASVSKPFVATAIVSLAVDGALDLDAPITDLVPELRLADGGEREVTVRSLLSHTSGLPDVTEYGWHDPQLGDDALSEFASSLGHLRLSEPAFSYSNAGYELLGLLLSRVAGTTFESAARQVVLSPFGMTRSTFLRADVPPELAASPHIGLPLAVPGTAYPYTRRHAPSSTLHSNLLELCRWMGAQLGQEPAVDADVRALMQRPVASIGEPPWDEAQGLGWAVGSYRGHRIVGHSGADPGFGSRLVLAPDRRTGVVVLANSNTLPTAAVTSAALSVALGVEPVEEVARLDELLPPVVGPVSEALAASGHDAARAAYDGLAGADPPAYDLNEYWFEAAVWGAIELHRTDLAWPMLRLWTGVRPESSTAWTMTGWAEHVDGLRDRAREHLQHALELDPDNEDAAAILGNLPRA